MGKSRRDFIRLAVYTVILALLIWHMVSWHVSGMYLLMFQWLSAGRGWMTSLYNLGIMLVMGFVLGLWLEKMTDLLGVGGNQRVQLGRKNNSPGQDDKQP